MHALRYYTVGIPFWTACKSIYVRRKNHMYRVLESLDYTLPLRTTERYTETMHVKKMADL